MSRFLQTTLVQYLRSAILPGVCIGLLPSSLTISYKILGLGSGRISLILLIIASGLVLMAASWFLGLSGNQRKQIELKIKERFGARGVSMQFPFRNMESSLLLDSFEPAEKYELIKSTGESITNPASLGQNAEVR